MITGVFTILGVILGFYLAKYQEINKKFAEEIPKIKKKLEEKKYKPSVISTNEADLEREMKAEEKDRINLKDILQ